MKTNGCFVSCVSGSGGLAAAALSRYMHQHQPQQPPSMAAMAAAHAAAQAPFNLQTNFALRLQQQAMSYLQGMHPAYAGGIPQHPHTSHPGHNPHPSDIMGLKSAGLLAPHVNGQTVKSPSQDSKFSIDNILSSPKSSSSELNTSNGSISNNNNSHGNSEKRDRHQSPTPGSPIMTSSPAASPKGVSPLGSPVGGNSHHHHHRQHSNTSPASQPHQDFPEPQTFHEQQQQHYQNGLDFAAKIKQEYQGLLAIQQQQSQQQQQNMMSHLTRHLAAGQQAIVPQHPHPALHPGFPPYMSGPPPTVAATAAGIVRPVPQILHPRR